MKKIKTKLAKTLTIFLIFILLLGQGLTNNFVRAEDVLPLTPPTPPAEIVVAPVDPVAPAAPTQPDTNNIIAPTSPTAPSSPTPVETNETKDTNHNSDPNSENSDKAPAKATPTGETSTIDPGTSTIDTGVMVSEFNVADDHVGDIVLDFGANCVSGCATSDVQVENATNGADSTNNASASAISSDTTFQSNDATVENSLVLGANSGDNKANFNTGGDSTIQTGNANVSGNVLTFANNNLAGNVVYGVVNIYGDLQGDIIFPEEQLTVCCGGNLAASNTANGTGSANTAAASETNNTTTTQGNAATIINNLDLAGTTGGNDANFNTNGDSTVITGTSDVSANVVNVTNSNVDGGNMWLVLINNAGQWVGKLIGGDGNMAASDGTVLIMGPDGQITASNNGNG